MSNAVFCLSCLVHTNHFFFSFILLECVSICLYLLCGYNKKDIDSIEAALKYFIIGTFSSILLLLGISLLYGVFGSVQFDDLRMFISYELYNPILKFEVVACFIFIALGLLIKTYSAPFHYWALDIYEGAPLTSSFFFSTVYLLSIIYFFLKLYLFFFIKFDIFQYYFLFFSLNCFFFGTFGTLFQTKIRKLLAYSSVNTVGFVLLAFSTLDLENVEYSIIVLASYLINTSCLFSVLISVPITSFGELRTINKLNDFSLLHNSNSFLSFFVAFSFFFSSGLPPFVYFLYKSFFFSSLLQSYYLIIVLLLVLFSICSYFYFLRIVKVIYYSNPISSMSFNGVSKVTTLGAILMTFFMTLNVLLFCFFELFSYYALLIVLSI
jgi:NADH-quinone oxidoreductase subunit N